LEREKNEYFMFKMPVLSIGSIIQAQERPKKMPLET
jgi:hypothetical protein